MCVKLPFFLPISRRWRKSSRQCGWPANVFFACRNHTRKLGMGTEESPNSTTLYQQLLGVLMLDSPIFLQFSCNENPLAFMCTC